MMRIVIVNKTLKFCFYSRIERRIVEAIPPSHTSILFITATKYPIILKIK